MSAEKNMPRFRPVTDIIEQEDGFLVSMDMPGVAKDALSIELNDNELVVSGKTAYDFGKAESFVEVQFGNGEYGRSLSISDMVDRDNIKAGLKNGVLELFLPKLDKVQPRRIEIKAG